ncbi:MAG: hypothetical protein ACRCXB_03420 [Aeromonadaceae bacterium]
MMRLVSLKSNPMVPWFDSLDKFREVGVYNMGDDGVFVVAEYYGTNEWMNEMDPQAILDAHKPKVMHLVVPEAVSVGEEFTVAGSYPVDGKYILMIGDIPAGITVSSGAFSKKLVMPTPGVFNVSCRDVSSDSCQITVAL